MWVLAKYKINELETMKNCLKKSLDESIVFYNPKIKYQKYVKNNLHTYEKFILEGYIICKHTKFEDCETLAKLKSTKGLQYFLNGHFKNQIEINEFIKKCKTHEDADGYLKQDFFESAIHTKARFISGLFTNMIFSIISKQKNKLKIKIGNITTTIDNKSNYQYRTV